MVTGDKWKRLENFANLYNSDVGIKTAEKVVGKRENYYGFGLVSKNVVKNI